MRVLRASCVVSVWVSVLVFQLPTLPTVLPGSCVGFLRRSWYYFCLCPAHQNSVGQQQEARLNSWPYSGTYFFFFAAVQFPGWLRMENCIFPGHLKFGAWLDLPAENTSGGPPYANPNPSASGLNCQQKVSYLLIKKPGNWISARCLEILLPLRWNAMQFKAEYAEAIWFRKKRWPIETMSGIESLSYLSWRGNLSQYNAITWSAV